MRIPVFGMITTGSSEGDYQYDHMNMSKLQPEMVEMMWELSWRWAARDFFPG